MKNLFIKRNIVKFFYFLLLFFIFYPHILLSQTRLEGSFYCGSLFESYKYVFKKDGSFIKNIFTDYSRAYYGRGLYDINDKYLILNFDKITEDEFDTIFVHKEINVDSNNLNDPIVYKFFIQKYYPSSLYGALVCLYDSNENIIKPFYGSEDTCIYSDSTGCWNVLINLNNLPARIKIYYNKYILLKFDIFDHFSREIRINLKENWYYYYPYTSYFKVSNEKFEIRNIDTTSFDLLNGQNWYHFIKKD